MWPFFKLSPPILSMIGLQDSADSGALQIYDETEGYWLTVDIDHIMEVREGQHIFLRSYVKALHCLFCATMFVSTWCGQIFGRALSLFGNSVDLPDCRKFQFPDVLAFL